MTSILFGLILSCATAVASEPQTADQNSQYGPERPPVEMSLASATGNLEFSKKLLDEVRSEHQTIQAQIESTQTKLKDSEARFQALTTPSAVDISKDYQMSSDLWSTTADTLLKTFMEFDVASKIDVEDRILSYSENLSADDKEHSSKVFVEIRDLAKRLESERHDSLKSLQLQNFQLLQKIGARRSRVLQKCDAIDCDRPRGLNEHNLRLLVLEIQIVPLRFVAALQAKAIEVRTKFTMGLDSWIDLARQAVLLLLLFGIPFLLTKALRATSELLDRQRRKLLASEEMGFRQRTRLALLISRLNPFIPSVGMVIGLEAAKSVLNETDLREISYLLVYVQLYFIYRAAKILIRMALELVATSTSIDTLKTRKHRFEQTATRVSRLLFIEFLILHLTEDTVRKALAYHLFATLIFYVNLGFLFFEAYLWRHEITEAFHKRFRDSKGRMHWLLSGRKQVVFLPAALIAVALFDLGRFVFRQLAKLDLVKRLLSEVLKKRLERAEDDESVFGAPDSAYLTAFDYYLSAEEEILVRREQCEIQQALRAIRSWSVAESTEDSILWVANRGMGKSTSLSYLQTQISKDLSCVFRRVEPKLIDTDELWRWLSETLDHPIQSADDFLGWDASLTSKKVILIDDIQNLFLGKLKGFDCYRLFMDIVSLRTKNVFWCLTVNSHSWAYLRGFMGHEHFYGSIVHLAPWKDFEIQKLILSRHAKTGYSKSFDESIKAHVSDDSLGLQTESQFFRLLWSQSRGNPRAALMYWVSAISSPAPKSIHIGVPEFVRSSAVASMSDEALFILASIARHDSLTQSELIEVNDLSQLAIRKSLKESLDKELIWLDQDGRYRTAAKSQAVVEYYLIGKNFLYE